MPVTNENDGAYQLPKWIFALTVAGTLLLIGAVGFYLNAQLGNMKQDFQLLFADLRGDVKVLQTENRELSNKVTALTQRITDLVDRLDPPSKYRK